MIRHTGSRTVIRDPRSIPAAGRSACGAVLLLLAGFALGQPAHARTTDTWVTWFGWEGEQGKVVAPYADGGLVTAGYTSTSDGTTGWLARIDGGGSLIWSLRIWPSDFAFTHPRGLGTLSDGSIVLALEAQSFAWLLKVDGAGNLTWQKRFESESRITAFTILPTDELGIALGDDMGDGSHILRLDSDANVLESATMPGLLAQIDDIEPDQDGRLLVAGRPSPGLSWMGSIDLSTQSVIWQRELTLNIAVSDISPDGGGGLMVCGLLFTDHRAHVVGTDSLGVPRWHETVDWGERDNRNVTCDGLAQGGVVMAMHNEIAPDDAITWLAVDAQGAMQWSWELRAERDEMQISELVVTDSGDIVMVGDADIPDVPGADKALVLRAHADGSLEAGCVYPGTVSLIEQPPLASVPGTVTLEPGTRTLVDGDLLFELTPANTDFVCCPFGTIPEEVGPPGSGPDTRLHWTDKRTIAWEPLDDFPACSFTLCQGDLPYDPSAPGRCGAGNAEQNSFREPGADAWDGRAYFYLVGAENDRHRGSIGKDSLGNERQGYN